MTMVVIYLSSFVFWVLVKGYDTDLREKRILLNDPSYIQQQFDHLQSEFQDLLVKVNGQQNTIASQQSTIASQQTTISKLESKISNETFNVAALQSSLASQQSGINSQHSTIASQQSQIQDLLVKVNGQQSTIASQQTTINNLQAKVSNDSSNIAVLQSKLTSEQSGRGISFVRWGRKDCPANFAMVYTGYAGGSWFADNGAAVDYLCMPHEPIWGPNKNKLAGNSYFGYVFGAEYESPAVYGMTGYGQDVPCAFCHSTDYSTKAMIPGRTACYPGWTEVYHGDLSCGATHYAAASQYVCVDQHPQALDGGQADIDGKLFYAVKAKCGALKCPPYEDEKLLSCVVCVK